MKADGGGGGAGLSGEGIKVGGGPLLLPPLETSSSYVMRRFFALRLSAKCWACSFSMTFAASFGARALIRRNVVILWLWLHPARPLTRR